MNRHSFSRCVILIRRPTGRERLGRRIVAAHASAVGEHRLADVAAGIVLDC
jgi:hypothetical protein